MITPSLEEREVIAQTLGVVKCDHCLRLCPYCPRLMAIRPDLMADFDPQPSPEPSFFQRAANFSRAITQHLAAGLPAADEEMVTHRLDVCHVCNHFDAARAACRVCGCNMMIKVRWLEQKCPIGRW